MAEWSACVLAMWLSQFRVLLWPLAGFVLCHPEFKSSVTLVNTVLLPVGVFNPVMLYLNNFIFAICC